MGAEKEVSRQTELDLQNGDSGEGTTVQGGEESCPCEPDQEGGRLAELEKALEGEKSRADEYYNRLARVQADFENYRKRTAREREDFLRFAAEQIINDLLPVLDNFERALAARYENTDSMLSGIEMIYRQFQDILGRAGLEPVAAEGEIFNPERHEAVMKEINEECPENTITQELRRGYCLKGKVIRPAMVRVAGR